LSASREQILAGRGMRPDQPSPTSRPPAGSITTPRGPSHVREHICCHPSPAGRPFHDQLLTAVPPETAEPELTIYVPVAQFCDALRLDLKSQLRKLKKHTWSRLTKLRVEDTNGHLQETWCISHAAIPTWLLTIPLGKVRAKVREHLGLYQREASDVLYHFFLRPNSTALTQPPGGAPRPLPISRLRRPRANSERSWLKRSLTHGSGP
jgi:hypothetical protein